jgi:hypothetical protein
MSPTDITDIIQTAGIIFNGIVLVYVVLRLERALGDGSDKMRAALTHQKETLDSLNTVWKRINQIETRLGMKSDHIPADELRATLNTIHERLDDIENKNARR